MYDRKKETMDIIRGLITGEYVLADSRRTLEAFGSGEMIARFVVRTPLGSRTFPYSMFDPSIKKVIFHDPATIVLWNDGTKTVVKCGENDIFDPEKGLAMAIAKKALGNNGSYYNLIKKWLPEPKEHLPTSETMQKLSDGLGEKSDTRDGGD